MKRICLPVIVSRLFTPIFWHYFSQFGFYFFPWYHFPFECCLTIKLRSTSCHLILFFIFNLRFFFTFSSAYLPGSWLLVVVIGSFNPDLERWSCASRFASTINLIKWNVLTMDQKRCVKYNIGPSADIISINSTNAKTKHSGWCGSNNLCVFKNIYRMFTCTMWL